MKVKPLNKKIFVGQLNKARKNTGPFVEISSPNIGEVLAVADDADEIKAPKVGSKVYFGREMETISVDSKEILVMDLSNLLGVQDGTQE